MGKDRKGNKRQDDNWGGLGTMNTKLFHFQQVQKLSLGCCYRETQHPHLSATPNLPFASWLCLWAKYPPLHKLGAQKKLHISQAQVSTPASRPLSALGGSYPAGHAAAGLLARQELPRGSGTTICALLGG